MKGVPGSSPELPVAVDGLMAARKFAEERTSCLACANVGGHAYGGHATVFRKNTSGVVEIFDVIGSRCGCGCISPVFFEHYGDLHGSIPHVAATLEPNGRLIPLLASGTPIARWTWNQMAIDLECLSPIQGTRVFDPRRTYWRKLLIRIPIIAGLVFACLWLPSLNRWLWLVSVPMLALSAQGLLMTLTLVETRCPQCGERAFASLLRRRIICLHCRRGSRW